MAQTPEGKVKDQIKKILKARGAVYCMPATGGFGKSGVSDFIVCDGGHFIAIEAKAGKGTTTALQDKWLAEVEASGGKSLVINENNVGELNQILEDTYWERFIKGNKCKKCKAPMRPGVAIQQTYTGTPDFPGDKHPVTMSPGGKGRLVDCLKCPQCGWSVTK